MLTSPTARLWAITLVVEIETETEIEIETETVPDIVAQEKSLDVFV